MSGVYPTLPSAPVEDIPPSYDATIHGDGTLPPSYDQLYGEFRTVHSPSTFARFIDRVFKAVSRTATATVIFAVLNIVPIGMIVIGAINDDRCKAQPKIPLWLMITGCGYLIRAALGAYQKYREQRLGALYRPSCCLRLTNFTISAFLAIWFILGSIWVYSVKSSINHDPSSDYYCDEFMYTFSFVFITLTYILMALSFFVCCCCCCFICCRTRNDDGRFRANSNP